MSQKTIQNIRRWVSAPLRGILRWSFISSFRQLRLSSLLIPLLDFAKALGIVLIYFIISSNLNSNLTGIGLSEELKQNIAKNIGNYDYAPAIKEKIGDAQKFQSGFQVVLAKLIINLALGIIAAALVIALANFFIWKIVTKKRLRLRFILKYFALLLIWNIPWILLFLAIAYKFKPALIAYAVPIEAFTFIYFSFLLYPLFAGEERVFRAIYRAFTLGAMKFHRIIGNVFMVYILYILIFALFLRPLIFSLFYIYFIMLIAIAIIAWLRYFMLEVVNHAQQ
ncbi:hypothetical protein HYU13_04185 [Candidatus Woesearchaeota archaeon]|nr:hypothetical protein [Candidatus Woesearchaeota archaeon]